MDFLIDFGRQKGAQRGAFREPKSTKIRPKIDPKTGSKFKSEKVASWDRLGSIWGRFGGCPGAFLLIFYWFSYYFVNIGVFKVKTIPRRFEDEIWSKMAPNWGPKTAQNRSKIDTKNHPNFDAFLEGAGGGLGTGSGADGRPGSAP